MKYEVKFDVNFDGKISVKFDLKPSERLNCPLCSGIFLSLSISFRYNFQIVNISENDVCDNKIQTSGDYISMGQIYFWVYRGENVSLKVQKRTNKQNHNNNKKQNKKPNKKQTTPPPNKQKNKTKTTTNKKPRRTLMSSRLDVNVRL